MENLKIDGIKYLLGKIKEYLFDTFVQLKDAILTVNGEEPDENGNINIVRVDRADNLVTSFRQNSTGTFLQRSSGGSAAIVSGEAKLMSVYGNSVHENYEPDIIEVSVYSESEEDQITAKLTDKDTFLLKIENSGSTGTITLTYSTASGEWSEEPVEYGITVEGTPINNDQISIEYTKEVRGLISPATPDVFVSTGWNLYDPINQYAKVVRYSDEYGYRIDGDFSSISFSTTPSGTPTPITPANRLFQVPSDGYILVSGGNTSNTAIYPTWSDWTGGYPGGFEEFTTSIINLASVRQTYFPYGLCSVGSVRDEIAISQSRVIRRIDRVEYSYENLQYAKSTGRGYEYDEDYIYIVRSNPETSIISLNGTYEANDHGIEYFTETIVPTTAQTNYSMNIKNKLERDTVTISQQTLSAVEQAQIRTNIDAPSKSDIANAIASLNGSIIVREYSYKSTADVTSGGTKTVSAENYGIQPIDGYTPAAAVVVTSGSKYFVPYACYPVLTGTVLSIRNVYSSTVTSDWTSKVRFIWIKNELLGQ